MRHYTRHFLETEIDFTQRKFERSHKFSGLLLWVLGIVLFLVAATMVYIIVEATKQMR